LFQWEKELERQLLEIVSNTHWNKEKSDEWCWVGEHGNDYTVRSRYRALKGALETAYTNFFRVVWDLKVPGKAKNFGWRAMLDRLPSRINLERRGVILLCNLCPLCRKEMETLQHLLTMKLGHGAWYPLPRFGSTFDADTPRRRVRYRVRHLIFYRIRSTIVDTEIRHGTLCWTRVSYQNGNIQTKLKSQYSNTKFNIKTEILISQTKSQQIIHKIQKKYM